MLQLQYDSKSYIRIRLKPETTANGEAIPQFRYLNCSATRDLSRFDLDDPGTREHLIRFYMVWLEDYYTFRSLAVRIDSNDKEVIALFEEKLVSALECLFVLCVG